ncbi:Diguanylate cyclase, GGDEF domain [Devosia psychrophila]|uniref:Diguanylate cyclase, GGDEF domain n=1 Tax=Devosia psychrophila TaxID=728005 RepID=A0A1I1N3B5_9HYPH|nr:Diguanylate cyclase, GGDEF domain [Devosia psychrophila]
MLFRGLSFPGSHPPISISASFGIAVLDPNSDDVESVLQKADESVYEAKSSGRNQCTTWRQSGNKPEGERRRVLKAGKVVFNNRHSTVDCTLRALGESSAEIALPDAFNVPDSFILWTLSDGMVWPCSVTGRTEQRVIVAFD